MKSLVLAFTFLAGLAAPGAEDVVVPDHVNPGTAGPRMQFAESFFDFGRVQSGKIYRHDYVFTNTGDQVLEITGIRSSCGCAAVTNWDRRIEPGKTGTLPVLFNSGNMAGAVVKDLWVSSNVTNQPALRLQFAATVWKLIDAIPGIATFAFGPDFQTNETRIIRLISNQEEPVTLSPPECTNRSFRAELRTVKPGKEFELQVSVVPPLGAGSQTAAITLKTSLPQMPVVSVTAYALVQPALTLSPPRILLPLPVDEAMQFIVKIRNNGSRAVTLSDPGINVEGATVQLREIQPGKLFDLVVTFPAGFPAQPGKAIEARVKSDHPQAQVVTVPVTQLKPTGG